MSRLALRMRPFLVLAAASFVLGACHWHHHHRHHQHGAVYSPVYVGVAVR